MSDDDLGDLGRNQLLAHAKALGIDVNVRMTKDDLLAAIAQVEFDTAVAEQAEPGPTMLAPPAHLGHPGQIGHPAG
jgi:hypothetical protein